MHSAWNSARTTAIVDPPYMRIKRFPFYHMESSLDPSDCGWAASVYRLGQLQCGGDNLLKVQGWAEHHHPVNICPPSTLNWAVHSLVAAAAVCIAIGGILLARHAALASR